MSGRYYTIGELARLGGVSTRRLRFWSDAGLLPPSARTGAGYRAYSEADLARLQMIVLLRQAGVGLDQMRALLARDIALTEVLRLRLDALTGEIKAKLQVAAALRGALSRPAPDITTLEEMMTMMAETDSARRAAAERLVARVVGDSPVDPGWRAEMIRSMIPPRPENPTDAQIAAHAELSAMLADPAVIAAMSDGYARFARDVADPAAYRAAGAAAFEAGRRLHDHAPDGPEGRAVAQAFLAGTADARGVTGDARHADWLLAQNARFAEGQLRYAELMSILGDNDAAADRRTWLWLNDALTALRGGL